MHGLEPEIGQLLKDGHISADTAREPLAIEHRAIFSLRSELLSVLYAGVAAVATGVGLVVKDHLDQIGPVAITTGVGVLAAACYLPAIQASRQGRDRRPVGDYLLLLGALLASADLGYAEYAFQLFGSAWPQHFLLLAAVHGATAYLLRSRLVLSVALTAFAAWVGAEATFSPFFPFARAAVADAGLRCLVAATALLVFRFLHARRLRDRQDFIDVFEGFAVHLAGTGALLRLFPGYFDQQLPDAGFWANVGLLAIVTALIGSIGWRRRQEHLVLAALGYAVVGMWRIEFRLLHDPLLVTWASLLTLVAATSLLWRLRRLLREGP
ncbi:MAG: hypothetical protein RLZZ200_2065 [Pseudomonadota bacterium]|jgi:hypothetical protein